MARHTPTEEAELGLGYDASTSLRSKPGKSNIWDPAVCYTPSDGDSYDAAAKGPLAPAVCSLEYSRMQKALWLKNQVSRLQKKHQGLEAGEKAKVAVMAFERFQMRCSLQQTDGEGVQDPLLPVVAADAPPEPGLVSDLMRVGCSRKQAEAVALEIAEMCTSAAAEQMSGNVRGQTGKKRQREGAGERAEEVLVVRHKHTMDLTLRSGGKGDAKKLLKLNPTHYDKLREMYSRWVHAHALSPVEAAAANAGGQKKRKKKKGAAAAGQDLDKEFHIISYDMIRYNTL